MQLYFMPEETLPWQTAPQRSISDIKCVKRSYPYTQMTKDTMYSIENSLCNSTYHLTPNGLPSH